VELYFQFPLLLHDMVLQAQGQIYLFKSEVNMTSIRPRCANLKFDKSTEIRETMCTAGDKMDGKMSTALVS
jgi:hypothetical protein